MQSFSKSILPYWPEIPIFLEASNEADMQILQKLGSSLSNIINTMDSDTRQKLHFAAVWVNNFTNHMLYEAEKICLANDLSFSIMEPLARETIRKAFSLGAFNAQTGPALRGDARTLEKHLKIIGEDEEERTLYIMLSHYIRAAHSKKVSSS